MASISPVSAGRPTFVRRLFANRSFTIGLALVGTVVLLALLAGVIAPFDPLKGNFRARMVAPNAVNWMGTDHFGRDILSRVLFGARISLQIALMVALITAVAGVLIGATAGYFRRTDGPIMRLMDAFMAFPSIILAIAISAVLGASVLNVIIALSIAATPHTARIVRASVMAASRIAHIATRPCHVDTASPLSAASFLRRSRKGASRSTTYWRRVGCGACERARVAIRSQSIESASWSDPRSVSICPSTA